MSKKAGKNLIIFDGSNFYHGSKKIAPKIHLTEFNHRKLAEVIIGGNCDKIEYCVGEIRWEEHSEKSQRLYANQQSLFYNLEKQDIEIKKGYMLRSRFSYHEKGVDVRIALDILLGAIKDTYDSCYLVSSDTDLIPAITEARKLGKQIIYVGFENFISKALSYHADRTILITKKLLKDLMKKK